MSKMRTIGVRLRAASHDFLTPNDPRPFLSLHVYPQVLRGPHYQWEVSTHREFQASSFQGEPRLEVRGWVSLKI